MSSIFGLKKRITLVVVVAAALAYSAQIYGGDGCVHSVNVGWISGTWNIDCVSDRTPSDPDAPLGVRHARFYTFTLDAPSDVTVTLASESNPYLYLLAGEGRDGAALHSNNNISANDFNARIEAALPPGNYTIEATTYAVGIGGNFILTFDAVATAAPVSSLTPTLTPTPTTVSRASDYASTLMDNIVAIGEAKLGYQDTQDLCASALEHANAPERLQEPPEVRRWLLTLLDACEAQHIRNKPTATPTMTPSPTATRVPSDAAPDPSCSNFRPGANLSNCDLRGVNLTGAQLQGVNLSGADISETQFRDANMDGAILTGAIIRASRRAHNTQKFRGATLTNITFSNGVNLSGVGFINADLSNSSLINANLEDADFRNATLRKTDLSGASLESADLGAADLRDMKADNKTTFDKADLAKANLSEVVWSNANFEEADMSGANLNNAEFERGTFNDVDFSNADLEDTDFSNADLDGADFDGAKLDDTDFKEADLTDAKNMDQAQDIRNAKWDDTTCPDGTNSDDIETKECYPNNLVPSSS